MRVASAVQDIGTGTYTIMAQMAAERLGVPIERVEVALGDTRLPAGPVSGGSMATASLVAPVHEAAAKACQALIARLRRAERTLRRSQGGGPRLRRWPGRRQAGRPACDRVRRRAAGAPAAVADRRGVRHGTFGSKEKPTLSRHSYGAHFVEVTWQPEIARLRVARAVSVIDAGRILNPLAARNQIEGAVVMGVGMALLEETDYDPRSGAPVNASLADYLVATHADAPRMEVHFVEYPDTSLNELGARGVGEIGLAGIAAAITNAVYHATGVRVRDLPLRLEQLMA